MISRVSVSLSLPTFRERNNASSHHDNNDDGGKRLHRGQGFVPVIPKLEHALVSVESAPSTEKIPLCRKDVPLRPKMQCYLSSRAF